MIAAMMAAGLATHQIPPDPEREIRVCQMFLAIHTTSISDADTINRCVIASLGGARYTGERVLRIRRENLASGIPVDETIWAQLESLAANGL